MTTKKQLEEDIRFLAKRACGANYVSFSDHGRSTGLSSNSLISCVYGIRSTLVRPGDISDYVVCENAFNSLPEHRKNKTAKTALKELKRLLEEHEL